ncbi:MAG: hypothetical protein WCF17_09065 [Terracidiphilus sp.]
MGIIALLICLVAGCADISTPDSANNFPILQEKDVNGVSTWAVLPSSYSAQRTNFWIIYNHGFGQTIASILQNNPQSEFVGALAAAGFVVVASEYRDPSCWGNESCAEDIANLEDHWRSRLNLAPKPFVIGESMGGIVTWNAISHGTLTPQAAVGIYPVCNLAAMYEHPTFDPSIQSAYGITSEDGYAAATEGYDPMLTPASDFSGFPIAMWASNSDDVVKRSLNENPFASAIRAAGGTVTIHTSTGNHGDPSNFDAPSVISFFRAFEQ